MARLSKFEEKAMEEFGFEVSAPPERERSRRSRHAERWEAARAICQKMPGRSVKIISFNQASSGYTAAKAINNGENKSFSEDYENWKAVAAHDPSEDNPKQYSLWLTYTPQATDEGE